MQRAKNVLSRGKYLPLCPSIRMGIVSSKWEIWEKVSGHLKLFQGQTFKNNEKLARFCIYHGYL